MLDYIWISYEKPILKQVSKYFRNAAIILSPFIQMPKGWTNQERSNNSYEHIYPDYQEIINISEPVTWKEIIHNTGLVTYEELALALKSSISALKKEYARDDLAEILINKIGEDIYYPNEDKISEYIIPAMLKTLGCRGAQRFCFSDPINDKSGYLYLSDVEPYDIENLYSSEVIIIDENMDYAFLSVYDSFITIFLCKNNDISDIIKNMGWEAIICSEDTYINWYWKGKR